MPKLEHYTPLMKEKENSVQWNVRDERIWNCTQSTLGNEHKFNNVVRSQNVPLKRWNCDRCVFLLLWCLWQLSSLFGNTSVIIVCQDHCFLQQYDTCWPFYEHSASVRWIQHFVIMLNPFLSLKFYCPFTDIMIKLSFAGWFSQILKELHLRFLGFGKGCSSC